MSGRVCVVTGASGGIGKAAATELARRGATVALVLRSPERGAAARDEIVRHIHVLLNNAATYTRKRTVTADGSRRSGR
jgi:NAD(P)-dependent dehydrogenase (short-subunit alcohol dehydrogenase family)